VKHCVKLRESGRYRREAGAALLSGADLVLELAPYCAPYRALVALDEAQLPVGDAWAATYAFALLRGFSRRVVHPDRVGFPAAAAVPAVATLPAL
jgi:hypothetical protein